MATTKHGLPTMVAAECALTSFPKGVSMITILGASGQVGHKVTTSLLRSGVAVRALGRSSDKLRVLQDHGAEALPGDASDRDYLERAFADAEAAFVLMPHDVTSNDYHAAQDRQGEVIATALARSPVQHIVFLSSLGADRADGTGVVSSLHRQEIRLRQIERNLLCLRPGSFFENWHASLHVIRSHGFIADAVAPEIPVPMVSTADIAAVAADRLMHRDWRGTHVCEVVGPRDLTYAQVAMIIGNAIDRPELTYAQLSYGALSDYFIQAGFSPNVAREYVELSKALNESRIVSCVPEVERIVGRSSFESFSNGLAAAYRHLPTL